MNFISNRLKVDKLLVTLVAVRVRVEKVAELFEADPTMANAALRKLIPANLSAPV